MFESTKLHEGYLERLPIILKFLKLDKLFLGHFLINITLWKHIQFHLFHILKS